MAIYTFSKNIYKGAKRNATFWKGNDNISDSQAIKKKQTNKKTNLESLNSYLSDAVATTTQH